jgi:nitrite reductase/ring-hydroxylating ferredoxin subunit
MRRAPGLVEISRRDFCAIACAGVGAVAIAGCEDGDVGVVQTGALGGGDDQPPVDAPSGVHPGDAGVHDAPMGSNPDAGPTGPACSGSPVDVGAASAFAMSSPVYFSTGKFFVVRDAGGLFAVSASCTHEGATCAVSSGRIRCPRHNALFNYDGSIISGPVSRPLSHFAMCITSSGHVGVMTTQTVTASQRLNA